MHRIARRLGLHMVAQAPGVLYLMKTNQTLFLHKNLCNRHIDIDFAKRSNRHSF